MPPIDLIFEATGNAAPGFAAMEILGNNGVLVLLSGASGPAELTVPAAAINGSLLRGNKVVAGSVNSAREDFELGVDRPDPFRNALAGSDRPAHHPPPRRSRRLRPDPREAGWRYQDGHRCWVNEGFGWWVLG